MRSPPKRILATADTAGGVFVFALELARELSARGVEVLLATMGGLPSREQREEALAIPGLRLESETFALEWMAQPFDQLALAGKWLLGLASSFRPDLVHLGGYAHGVLPFGVPSVITAHSCVLSWWEAVHGEPARAGFEAYARMVRRGLAGTAAVVAPTHAMLRALHRHHDWSGPPLVIHNGCEPPPVAPGIPKEQLILTAGRLWDRAKGADTLDAAAPAVAWPIYAAGPERSPEGAPIELRALRRLGVLSRADLAGWLARASIYAHPARYEPFGLSALEAARAGCALVLGDIPSLRELWAADAIYVDPDDPRDVARTLSHLIRDARLRTDYGARARVRAERYTRRRMGREYCALFERLVVSG